MEFHKTETHPNWGMTVVLRIIIRLCRQEKEKVSLRVKPNNLIVWENM